MNKKATIFHWIIFIILAAAALIYIFSTDMEIGEYKGIWQIGYVRAFQYAEKDLLFLDQEVTKIAGEVSKEIPILLFSSDLGCGKVQEVPLWNQKERFCPLKIEEKFTQKFKSIFDPQNIFNYTLTLQGQQLIGKTNVTKTVTHVTKGVMPTEGRSAGLLTFYEAYLMKPFDLRYNYNPNFKVKMFSLSDYAKLEQQARLLVKVCQNEVDLKTCLNNNKEEGWKYGKCVKEEYLSNERQVVFCVSVRELFGMPLNRVSFALDFTSPTISSPKKVQMSLQGTQVKVSFNPVTEAESYNLYYTNWDPAPVDYPQEAQSLFFASQGKYFYSKQTLINPQACPTDHQVNVPYLCGDQILYWLNDPKVIPGEYYYFAVTGLKGGDESLIYELIKLDSSG